MGKLAPLLSVIVPAYNEERFLAKCLNSLMKQDLDKKKYEIIVVNNASTDKTGVIAKRFPVKLVYEAQRSVVLARQKGLMASRGKIIVSADADTIYPPSWLTKIVQDFEKDPKIIALVGWIYFTDTSPLFNYSVAISQEVNVFLDRLTGKFPLVFACNFAFYRKAIEKIGGYPTHLPELGDQQYVLSRLNKIGKVVIDKDVYCHTSSRRHSSTLKNIFLYNGWYRIAGYMINKLLGFTVIGPAPAVRTSTHRARKLHY